jgi:DNA-binding NtrC family response regulator
MQDAIQRHEFREDLYFRLNVVSIHIPALRDRRGDIIPLVEYFNTKYSDLNGVIKRSLTQSGIERITRYAWPGNVRELDNIIHRSVLLSSGDELDIEIVDDAQSNQAIGQYSITQHASQVTHSYMKQFVGKTIDDVERDLILSTLETCHGNRTHAARILGISIRTLRNKLNHYIETGRIDGQNAQFA